MYEWPVYIETSPLLLHDKTEIYASVITHVTKNKNVTNSIVFLSITHVSNANAATKQINRTDHINYVKF